MSDKITEVTTVSWGSRLSGSIGGMLFGVLLFAAAFPLLFWNESRAVKTAAALAEGAGAVVSVSAERVDPSNEGRLVHVTGQAVTEESLSDPLLGVSATALKLRRQVEMFQWVEREETETVKKVGGSEERRTTYSYSTDWKDEPVDSGSFKEPAGHANPGAFPIKEEEWSAGRVSLGAFALSPGLAGRLRSFKDLDLPPGATQQAAAALGREVRPSGSRLYLGQDPAAPRVGDVRIGFSAVPPGPVSVAARQAGGGFAPYRTQAGRELELLQEGTASAEGMFERAQSENALVAWLLRLAGVLMMFFGLSALFRPLVVVADVLPFLGRLAGAATGAAAFALALALSLVTIAVAWFAARPLLSAGLAAGAVGSLWLVRRATRAAEPAPAASPATPG